jgi:uncharacterized protein (UPF0332 family)
MAFDPVNFFHLAETIYSSNKDETGCRATIGRVYYAAFLSARNKAGISSRVFDGHKTVAEHYSSSSDEKSAAIGNRLNALRVSRTNSDYDCDIVVTSRDVGRSFSQAFEILNALGCALVKKTP